MSRGLKRGRGPNRPSAPPFAVRARNRQPLAARNLGSSRSAHSCIKYLNELTGAAGLPRAYRGPSHIKVKAADLPDHVPDTEIEIRPDTAHRVTDRAGRPALSVRGGCGALPVDPIPNPILLITCHTSRNCSYTPQHEHLRHTRVVLVASLLPDPAALW